jgi:hypothetical protein
VHRGRGRPQGSPLRDAIVAFVASHPGGVAPADVREETGKTKFHVSQLLRQCVDQGLLRKKNGLYFPG